MIKKLGRKWRERSNNSRKVVREFEKVNNVQLFRPWLRANYPDDFAALSEALSGQISKERAVQFLFPDYDPRCEECKTPTKITPTGSLKFGYQRFCSRQCSNKAELTNARRSEASIKKYGVANISQSVEVKERKRKTCLREFGADNFFKSDEFKKHHKLSKSEWLAKCVETSMSKYGTRWPIQNPDLYATWDVYLKKEVRLKNGNVIECQGYEPIVISAFDSDPKVSKLFFGDQIPTIPYIGRDGLEHMYYPDLGVRFIDRTRQLVEVKSDYTIRLALSDGGLEKFKAATKFCTSHGYDFVVAVVKIGCAMQYVTNPVRKRDFKGAFDAHSLRL